MTWLSFSRAGRFLWRGLADLLYPPACLGCRRPLVAASDRDDSPLGSFCSTCAGALQGDGRPVCPCCAASVGPHTLIDEGCSRCRGERYAFESACRLGVYEGTLREMVLRLKFARSESLAELMGELLAVERSPILDALGADLIVPVPLHWWRRLRRGYNQSEAIARGLARHLRLPLASSCLRRIRRTPSQVSLPASSRRDNVRGAFRASGSILQGRTILLVDDVFTTGATLHESARALRAAGAGRIVVAVLARPGID